MSKRNISILVSLLVIFISFYYTNTVIKITRNKDPIMIEIMNYSNDYNDTKIEALIENNTIIPGCNGENIDINKSYLNMKKVGKFDKKLLVFQETYPDNKIKDTYNKFIISGNKSKKNISILFIVEDTTNIKEILSILKSKKVNATFFLKSSFFEEHLDLIKLITSLGNEVELLSKEYKVHDVNKANSSLKLVSEDKLNFCITERENLVLLSNCKESKLHTVIPNIIVDVHLYNNIKNNLDNGSIILIKENKSNLKELLSSLNYITQKGKNIVLLKNMLDE